MADWQVELVSKAHADLAKLDRPMRWQVLSRLEWLAANFDTLQPAPLHGDWKGFFKFRIGDWRVVYSFESSKRLIKVHQIDRRDKIYRRHT